MLHALIGRMLFVTAEFTCQQHNKDAKWQLTVFAVLSRKTRLAGARECMMSKVLVTCSSVPTLCILETHQFCNTSLY